MKNPLVVSFVAVAISLVGCATLWMNVSARAGATSVPVGVERPDPELLAHLESLSREVRALNERILELEMRPDVVPVERVPVLDQFVTREEFAALAELLEKRSPEGKLGGTAIEFEGQVAEALEQIRWTEAHDKAAASFEKRSSPAAVEQRVQGWSRWLGLDDVQQVHLTELMTLRDQREGEALRAWESGSDKETVERMRDDFESEFFTSIRGILSVDQADTMARKLAGDEE